tara:strand:+ start:1208 stop:2284 length:1077 start_codon:yes stop_codon:yes gene_type:complete
MEAKSIINAAESAANWLILTQDIGNDAGFASHYHLSEGWYSSYPEVTGYIIPTLIEYGVKRKRPDLFERTIKATDWLLAIQMEEGGFQGRLIDDNSKVPVIFNTGMILFGLVSSYKKTNDIKYLNAVQKAADWLVKVQDEDGVWRRYLTLNGTGNTHVYHTRVSWGLLEVYKVTNDTKYLEAARKNITWALEKQRKNGWFDLSCLLEEDNNQPLIHFHIYTVRGILESGLILNKKSWIDVAEKGATGFLKAQQRDSVIYGRYNDKWESTVDWQCVTGIAQISIIYMKLYKLTSKIEWLAAADKNIEYLISIQGKGKKEIEGAISGSEPVDKPYMPNCYVSWATKFFLETLLLNFEIKQ